MMSTAFCARAVYAALALGCIATPAGPAPAAARMEPAKTTADAKTKPRATSASGLPTASIAAAGSWAARTGHIELATATDILRLLNLEQGPAAPARTADASPGLRREGFLQTLREDSLSRLHGTISHARWAAAAGSDAYAINVYRLTFDSEEMVKAFDRLTGQRRSRTADVHALLDLRRDIFVSHVRCTRHAWQVGNVQVLASHRAEEASERLCDAFKGDVMPVRSEAYRALLRAWDRYNGMQGEDPTRALLTPEGTTTCGYTSGVVLCAEAGGGQALERLFVLSEALLNAWEDNRSLYKLGGLLGSQVVLRIAGKDVDSQPDGAYVPVAGHSAAEAIVWRAETQKAVVFPLTVIKAWLAQGGPSSVFGWPLARSSRAVVYPGDTGNLLTLDYCFEGGMMRYEYDGDERVQTIDAAHRAFKRICGGG